MEKLATKFDKEIAPKLQKDLGIKNIFDIPRIEKIVISAGIGDFKEDDKQVAKITEELASIAGQKPKLNKSRKAVSAFKLRIGQPVGLTVTLRGTRMFDFVDKLVNISLPRVRDFRGLSAKAFDRNGNYSIGLKEHAIFPEVKYEEVSTSFGFQINIKTTAKDDKGARVLLEYLGFPFEKKEHKNG